MTKCRQGYHLDLSGVLCTTTGTIIDAVREPSLMVTRTSTTSCCADEPFGKSPGVITRRAVVRYIVCSPCVHALPFGLVRVGRMPPRKIGFKTVGIMYN